MEGAGGAAGCPDGEGVASAGEELTPSERLTPGLWVDSRGWNACPEVYCPPAWLWLRASTLSSVFEEPVGVFACR